MFNQLLANAIIIRTCATSAGRQDLWFEVCRLCEMNQLQVLEEKIRLIMNFCWGWARCSGVAAEAGVKARGGGNLASGFPRAHVRSSRAAGRLRCWQCSGPPPPSAPSEGSPPPGPPPTAGLQGARRREVGEKKIIYGNSGVQILDFRLCRVNLEIC